MIRYKIIKYVIRLARYFNLVKTSAIWSGDFMYRKSGNVGREIQWLDLFDKVRTGVLVSGTKGRPCIPEACHPFVDTVKTRFPKMQEYIQIFKFKFNI